ncbi:MAG: helicase-associated domain-containing protein, partial [Propionibacteriaceae bacterium]|nr:helicase-associated domain-containing protein [Propionibacteriaceae bacterium]
MTAGLLHSLSTWSVEDLTALLAERVDLLAPPPADLAELADRAVAPASVRTAIDLLTHHELTVAEALAVLAAPTGTAPTPAEPTPAVPTPTEMTRSSLADLVGFDPDPAVQRLRNLGLLWGAWDHALSHHFMPWPGGLAGPSADPLRSAQIEEALLDLPEAAEGVLQRLAWGPPTGAVKNADRTIIEPATPVEHLLARGLLKVIDPGTVILPREVALHLRGGTLRDPVPSPPAPIPGRREARIIDSAAIGTAVEFVTMVEGLLDALTTRAPAPLRTGGLASRDLTVLANSVDTTAAKAAFALEVAYAARLLVVTGPAIVPTEAYQHWLEAGLADRYAKLLRTWFRSGRWYASSRADGGRTLVPAAAGAGAGPGNALGADGTWPRRLRETLFTALEPGVAVEIAGLAALVAWQRPALTRTGDLTAFIGEVLSEAEWLGVTAFGQVSTLAGGLSAPLPGDVVALFPDLVDHVVLQSDLTAVATGPVDRSTAATLALLAENESRGGGGVYRFTAPSLSRAFAAGWTGEAIEAWLARHSRTGVPQPLLYLIGDLARLHGTIRVGAARAYVRIDDPVRLATALEHPASADLGLRQVGPETLVADAEPAEVVTLLHSLGLTPAAENAAGDMVASAPPRRPPAPRRTRRPPPDPASIAATLVSRREQQRTSAQTMDAIATLRQAARQAQPIEVEFVAADGTRTFEILLPLDIAAGMVRFRRGDTPEPADAAGAAEVSLPLARITAAR